MSVANGFWIKAHTYRDGNWLKADVYMVAAGEAKVFTVGVDMARVLRAVKAYYAHYLHAADGHALIEGDCIGCDDPEIGSILGKVTKVAKKVAKKATQNKIAKTVKKVAKSKVVKQVAKTAKAVAKSKVTGGVAASLAVVFPPVGVPAAAAYATANAALAAIERGQAVKRAAVSTLQTAKKIGVAPKISDSTKKKLAKAVKLEKTAKKKVQDLVSTAKYSEDPVKKTEAAKMVKVLEVVQQTRNAVKAIPTAKKKEAKKSRVKGLVISETGNIVYGTFDENPLGRGAALLYRPGGHIRGSFTKIGGCVGCSLGSNPWPYLG